MNRHMIAMLVWLSVSILLTGCFGKQEINDLAMVTAVGLDVYGANQVSLSVQIVRPADARGQTGAPSGGTGEPIYSIQSQGRTIFEAARNLARFSSRRVYWAHNFVIVIGEKYARRGIADMIDFFTRNHELRMSTWVVVTPDKASEVIATITGMEVVPGEAIDKLFRYNQIVAEAPGSNMMRLQESFLATGTEPVLAKVQLKPRGISNKKPNQFGSLKQVVLSGAAVFKGDKMQGWLSPKDAKGLLPFIEGVDSEIAVVNCPDEPGKRTTLELKQLTQSMKPGWKDGKVTLRIKQKIDANLVELGCSKPYADVRGQLEEKLRQQMEDQVMKIFDIAQKQYRTDFLKVGQSFHNRYPLEWRKVASEWDDYFAEADVTVRTEVKLTSPVLKLKEPTSGKELK
ncbi:Ger(x)C family spore germination protein [Paenibacillus xanthanilyticus]|uniref:Ger(X)C family spore germination protein n=1 Tax=Paenibacillus xanthanilyticus TaxID=1783531 RepID=A0ABV8K701_9BACL